ncbi:MAG: GNAT family N-acetyltransferase [Prevotella sp.]|nr:GNAT family N-acetyltransferase [Prevotella sp.]
MENISFHPLRNLHEIDGLICGIDVMDEFLHSSRLRDSLIANHCDAYVVENDKNQVIGFFALDMTTLELDDNYKSDLMEGWAEAAKPEFQTEEELKAFLECRLFDVVDIAYLAVDKNYQRKGYGSEIMSIIFDLARIKKTDGIFMTVDALHLPNRKYSAVSFYERFGFQRILPPTIDTIRMFCTVYPHMEIDKY